MIDAHEYFSSDLLKMPFVVMSPNAQHVWAMINPRSVDDMDALGEILEIWDCPDKWQ